MGLEGRLGCSAHPSCGAECRGHAQYPAFAPGSSRVAVGFFGLFSFCVFCCSGRGVSRYKHCSRGSQVPACVTQTEVRPQLWERPLTKAKVPWPRRRWTAPQVLCRPSHPRGCDQAGQWRGSALAPSSTRRPVLCPVVPRGQPRTPCLSSQDPSSKPRGGAGVQTRPPGLVRPLQLQEHIPRVPSLGSGSGLLLNKSEKPFACSLITLPWSPETEDVTPVDLRPASYAPPAGAGEAPLCVPGVTTPPHPQPGRYRAAALASLRPPPAARRPPPPGLSGRRMVLLRLGLPSSVILSPLASCRCPAGPQSCL